MAWFDHAIIYQIYPKSFQDSNGDGIGDLKGIQQRIPYLKKLGINTVWLNPVFVSPQVDNGYDVANYFAIDKTMGTMDDMNDLIQALHDNGIHLLMDFVLNHTSDQHPWFQDAAKDVHSIYRDYYLFTGEHGQKPNNWGSFFGGSVWAPDPAGSGQSYFHLFDAHMPDLNWKNPQVRRAMGDVAEFWLNKGIDGLRLDAFIHIAKAPLDQDYPLMPGQKAPVVAEPFFANRPQVQTWLRPFCARIRKDFPNTFLLGEAASANVNLAADYTAKRNGLMDAVITFQYFTDDGSKVDKRLPDNYQPKPLDVPAFKQVQTIWQQGLNDVSMPVLYWNNHDMSRLKTRYAAGGKNANVSAKGLAMLMYLQRGLPIIYYGEELGMGNLAFEKPEQFADKTAIDFYQQAQKVGYSKAQAMKMLNATHKMAARGVMQWDETTNNGFSAHQPWLAGKHDASLSVAAETGDATSMLSFYQKLIALKKLPVFETGQFHLLTTDTSVYAYTRKDADHLAVVAVNLGAKEAAVTLPQGQFNKQLTAGESQLSKQTLTLAPNSGVVLLTD